MKCLGIGPSFIGCLGILPYSKLFYIAGRTHDIGYGRGGTEEDRQRIDLMFYKLMLSVSKTKLQLTFAKIYYTLVKKFGYLFFNYNYTYEV